MHSPLSPVKVHYDAVTDELSASQLEDPVVVIDGLTEQQRVREERSACVLFSLVGIGYLFPFSALTQPVDYWKMLFPDHNIEFAITSVFMYTNLVFLGIIVAFFGAPWYTGRIVGGFLGQLVVLTFVPTSHYFLSSENAHTVAVLGGTAAVSIATAFIDSSAFGLVSQYPRKVQECFQLGVGLSTLIGSVYRDITKLVFPEDELVTSTLIYFYTGALTIGLCIFAYYRLLRLKISKFYLAPKEEPPAVVTEVKDEAPQPVNKWKVLRKVLHLQLLTTLCFATSLALWPSLVTEIKSFNSPTLQANGWWSLILLTAFSIADCLGRILVGHRLGLNAKNVWIAVTARLVLVPVIILIVKEQVFTHDAWAVLFVIVMGYTHGFLGALTIILVNENVEPHEQQIAGPFTSFFLNLGLVIGASVGLLLQALVL